MHAPDRVPLYVRVDCLAHSRHRDPQGVYEVEVHKEASMALCASAAIQVAKDHIAFLDENVDKSTIRVFSLEGDEIIIPSQIDSDFHELGCFRGRVQDYPDTITIQ